MGPILGGALASYAVVVAPKRSLLLVALKCTLSQTSDWTRCVARGAAEGRLCMGRFPCCLHGVHCSHIFYSFPGAKVST